jgi:hypothetical protein
MSTTQADKLAYCRCMDQLSRRLRLIGSVVAGKWTTGDEAADAEFACLQLRKALEQLAFSALAASRERYSQARPQFEHEWSAKRILERVEKIHPHFYPLPVRPLRLHPNRVHFEVVADGFLTRDDFVFLYDKCSDVIHDWNPFREGPLVVQFDRPIAEWAQRIDNLLAFHRVRLVDQTDILVVELRDASGKAHVLTATPQEPGGSDGAAEQGVEADEA